ncbi:hypothetical protein SAMN04488038_102236 [Solimonas aquatica]|uniref:Uncharacterized protein n=1 Tax=Solimonas aquatica TaxID=489703 RepID=A0A1H9BV16_9GAMM|nr:hypothetical protein [Solimonas aquatica]SEP92709.1 hypothetical protein SAMN04488038_102236 [Solimonas aquatica]
MHPTTRKLFPLLTDPKKSIKEKLDGLQGAYEGQTVFILACGPSLSEYSPEKLSELMKDQCVMVIKQALDFVNGVSDFLLLNSWNFRRYDFTGERPVVIKEHGPKDPPVFLGSDIELEVPTPSDLQDQLALSKRFDDYTFEKSPLRPWGPGVLYEIGFYLAYHMRVKKIVTLGWDVGVKNSPQMPHFYDTTSPEVARILKRAKAIDDVAERNKMLHEAGVTYNRPKIIPEEVDVCAGVSGDWYDWLKLQGIELKACSSQSMIAERIPRTRIENELP